jgi:asparagine synthase (glutamine-hydrolysing)
VCGFVIQILPDRPVDPTVFDSMVDSLAHRGPDDRGIAFFKDGQVAFGHRRLSIIDLSKAGRQPLTDVSGRYCIVYNGEIYNFKELRERLEGLGHEFHSQTDTEVVLNAYIRWGYDCLNMLDGIFAFAIYDGMTGDIFLARDRFGIKPLYYIHRQGELLAASEPKALLLSGRLEKTIRKEALADYLMFGYISEDHGIWRELCKVPPGSWALFTEGYLRVESFMPYTADKGKSPWPDIPITREELEERFREAFLRTLKMQNISDVEIGLFLSGGLDSSSVALAQHLLGHPLRAFSVDFQDKPNNEIDSARQVADSLGIELLVCNVSSSDMSRLKDMQLYFDEPFADTSMLPTHLISRFARENGIKVALSGDGGDEIHGGYTWYGQCLDAIENRGPAERQAWVRKRYCLYPYQFYLADDQSDWFTPEFQEVLTTRRNAFFRHLDTKREDHLKAIQLLDVNTYLPSDILTKVDRASMAAGLELRVPLLGNEVTDLILSSASEAYSSRGEPKRLLSHFLKGYIPEVIRKKPKQGFSIPLRPFLSSINYREYILDSGIKNFGLFTKGNLERTLATDFDKNATRHILLYMLALWTETWLPS